MLRGFEKQRLDEVRVVLNLQSSGLDLGMTQKVVDELGLEVGDADGAHKFGGDERFHCCPGFLDRCFGRSNFLFAIDKPKCVGQ